MWVKVNTKRTNAIIERLGVGQRGRVQLYLTHEVRRRMTQYMPYRTGTLASKLTYVSSPTAIVVNAPYARYLYYGVSQSGKPLNYTKTHNPKAGPYWDRTLIADEGKAIAHAVQNYVNRRTTP